MTLVPHKITALAESDAQGTDGKNIVAGAVVSLFDEGGTAVTLFDNDAGANGNTVKTTDSQGQVVVYVAPGVYAEEINGGTRRSVVVSDFVGLDAAGQRATLELVKTTSPTDNTVGRITQVGDFGLGAVNNTAFISDCADPSLAIGFYSYTTTAINKPPNSGFGTLIVSKRISANEQATFIAESLDVDGSIYFRSRVEGRDTGWQEVWSTGNLIHAQNVSGGTVASNATVSGASLNPAQTGTWRNVSGNDILNNGYGLWSKV